MRSFISSIGRGVISPANPGVTVVELQCQTFIGKTIEWVEADGGNQTLHQGMVVGVTRNGTTYTTRVKEMGRNRTVNLVRPMPKAPPELQAV